MIEDAAGRRSGGQGFRISAEARRAIERHAMGQATAYYNERGWVVEDVSASQPFDLHCTKPGGEELRVEVKGTIGDGSAVLLTRGEVKHAEQQFPNVAFYLLTRVAVDDSSGAALKAGGGEERCLEPWPVENGRLRPVGFVYSVPEP